MKRFAYIIATILFLGVEVLIALKVNDDFVRPYIGDVLVVIVIYTFIRIFIPDRCRLLPLYIFVFAVIVEGLQRLHIVDLLGLSDNRFFSVLIGGTFDIRDIVCYGVGCILLVLCEIARYNHLKK